MTTLVSVVWIISGLILIAIGVSKWDWQKKPLLVRLIIKSMTEARIRTTCVLLGIGLIVIGILWMTGVII